MPYQPLSIKTHFLLRMGGGGGLHSLISTIKNFVYILLKFIGEQDSGKKKFAKSNTCCHSNSVSYALFSQTSTS